MQILTDTYIYFVIFVSFVLSCLFQRLHIKIYGDKGWYFLLVDGIKERFGQFCPLLDMIKSDRIIQNILVRNDKSRNVMRYLDKSRV